MDVSNFELYMNKPVNPVQIGKKYIRTDLFIDDNIYTVVDLVCEKDKFYAMCEYKDAFDGEVKTVKVFSNYLEEVK